jgi:hypothetical protein
MNVLCEYLILQGWRVSVEFGFLGLRALCNILVGNRCTYDAFSIDDLLSALVDHILLKSILRATSLMHLFLVTASVGVTLGKIVGRLLHDVVRDLAHVSRAEDRRISLARRNISTVSSCILVTGR